MRLYHLPQLLGRLIKRLGDGVPTCSLILWTRHRVLRSQSVSKKMQHTYDFFALFDTGFDLRNVSLGNIIFLLYLVFSEDL